MTVIHAVSPRTSGIRRTADGPVASPRGDREQAGPVSPAEHRRGRRRADALLAAPASRCRSRRIASAPSRGDDGGAGLLAGGDHAVAGPGREFRQHGQRRVRRFGRPVPDRLAVVRVEAGESLQDVAARVAPDAPARQVADRIRELNDSEFAVAGCGPDADRAGRLTASRLYCENRSTPRLLGSRGGEYSRIAAALAPRGSAQVRSGCSADRISVRRRSGHALSVLPASRFPGDRLSGNR